MTYAEASKRANDKLTALNSLLSHGSGATTKDIIAARGRYIMALQTQLRVAKKEGRPVGSLPGLINNQIQQQKRSLKNANMQNRRSNNYSMITEISLGLQSLANSVKGLAHARNSAERKQAGKDLLNSIGLNLKNALKAPVVMASRILSTSLVAKVIFAPVSIGMGILHAAWTCMDSNPPPFNNNGVSKMSEGFQKIATKANGLFQRM